MRRPVIGVMGPGKRDELLDKTAFELGRLIAGEEWILLTGGRSAGTMDAASRGAKSVPGSLTIGILPGDHTSADVSSAVDIAVFTNMGDARNAINVQSSDVVVALAASSAGTLSEIALALKAKKNVVLLQTHPQTVQFLVQCGGGRVRSASSAAAAVDEIKKLLG